MKVRHHARLGVAGTLAQLWHLGGAGARVLRWRLLGRAPDFGPLNGQAVRLRIVRALFERFEPSTVVETGTYLATTTGFLADRGLPTFSVEIDPKYVGIARVRLRSRNNVQVLVGHSSRWLDVLGREGQLDRPLVYLDAHRPGDTLPLSDELRAVEAAADHAIMIIDDCLIPHDSGYGYDTYGGAPIALSTLRLPTGSRSAYPAIPASAETGARRGTLYVGLGDGREVIEALVTDGLLIDATSYFLRKK